MGIIREQVPAKVSKYADGDDSVYDLHRFGYYIATLRPFRNWRGKGLGVHVSSITASTLDFLEEEPGREVHLKYKRRVIAVLKNESEE